MGPTLGLMGPAATTKTIVVVMVTTMVTVRTMVMVTTMVMLATMVMLVTGEIEVTVDMHTMNRNNYYINIVIIIRLCKACMNYSCT